MSTEYVGSVILYLGANEVEVTKIDVKDNTGKKPVKTMNRTRRVKGFTRGVGQDDAKISLVPDVEGARPTSYLGFCATEAGDSYTVDNELVVDVTGFAIRKVLE